MILDEYWMCRYAIDGKMGCSDCILSYREHCLWTRAWRTDDLDYLKALVDLDEEFDAGKVLDFLK